MAPYQTFPFVWDNLGSAFNEQVHGLFRDSSQPTSGPSTYGTSYQTTFKEGTTDNPQTDADIAMEYNEANEQPAPSTVRAQPATASSRRAKSEHLDWNAHKPMIKSLYIDQNKTLSETKVAMEQLHSFKASQKLYKTKFKEWNWQKNLPVDTALFIAEKSRQRKHDEGKDTDFYFGGKRLERNRVENTLVRAKKAGTGEVTANAGTPNGVSYKTPKSIVDSPPAEDNAEDANVEVIEISDDDTDGGLGDPTDASLFGGSKFALTWRGHSRADLQNMWRMALKSRDDGNIDEAEDMFKQVVLGLGHVLGKTNEDTVKAAYNLADLYANSGRMEEAMDVIEDVIQIYINMCGYEDKRTQQNVLHAVELLNGWNKEADALGLLSLVDELMQSSSSPRNARRNDSRAGKKGKAVQRPSPHGSQSDLSGVIQSINEDLSPARVEYGLGVARTRVAAKDEAAEGLLLAMISQCENHPDLSVQRLRAQAELLKLYDKMGRADEHKAAFEDALGSLNRAWEAYEWEEERIESLDLMEAVLQLVANVLKYGFRTEAKRIFRGASDKASDVFGFNDERTVWVLITIGLVYQTHMTWDDAEEWFEEAFAAALANKEWGPKDGMVRSLQNAMDHHHFSYVSDEGRPFKTIFGVSGITIRPGRLHLE